MKRGTRDTRGARSQRGFTLIELMVALVVSSLLVGMILAIFSRMSLAYRGQQQIAGVQQVLAAARATIELDAKQAGLGMSQGFRFASDPVGQWRPAVSVTDSANTPDVVRFYYADTTTQAVVTVAVVAWPAVPQVTVDATTGFAVGDLVVLSKVAVTTVSPVIGSDANIATYDACVLQVTGLGPTTLTFSTAAPWGNANTTHCTPAAAQTMVYKFVPRAYRIDRTTPARAALGLLQQSLTGDLLGVNEVWTDLAYGFTDLQTALRIYDLAAPDDDGDGDVTRNWYSGPAQDAKTALYVPAPPALPAAPIQISISLVARTDRDIEGIATAATPALIDPARPNNNSMGNHVSVALPDADPALGGSKIYRYTTFQVDLRNLGVGR